MELGDIIIARLRFPIHIIKLCLFLCMFTVGGMSRAPKPAATAKKVPPPAVPHEFRHSGSSFGSAGYASSEDAVFLAPSETSGVPRGNITDYIYLF